jgi:hypothetical protein
MRTHAHPHIDRERLETAMRNPRCCSPVGCSGRQLLLEILAGPMAFTPAGKSIHSVGSQATVAGSDITDLQFREANRTVCSDIYLKTIVMPARTMAETFG